MLHLQKRMRPLNAGRQRLSRSQRVILALVLGLLTLMGASLYQAPRAHAAASASGPIIHWDQSMIFQGKNKNNPWGPVGEIAVVHGEGFTSGQALKLIIVPGDSNTSPSACQPTSYTSPNSAVVGQATVSTSGTFDANFAWPAGIGQANGSGVLNSICALKSSDNTVVSSKDDGPFTVLTQSAPTVSLSTTTVSAGESITVSGQNWVPPQQLTINIANCADCDPGNSMIVNIPVNSAGQNTGTFSTQIVIPATATPANYVVNVLNQSGTLDAYHIGGVQHLAVTASLVTPTPTVAVSPTSVTTPTVVSSPTTTASSTASNSTPTSGGNGTTILILAAIIVVVLVIVGLIVFMLMQRKKQTSNTPLPPSMPSSPLPGGPAGRGQFNQAFPPTPGGPQTPFPTRQPVSTPGQFNSASPGNPGNFNQSWQDNPFNNFSQQQPWPGNPQSNGGFNNYAPQQPFPPQQSNFSRALPARNCVRCGNPLEPDSVICGNCGMRHTPGGNPGGPTTAY